MQIGPLLATGIYKDEARIAELERMIGQLTMEKALLKSIVTFRGASSFNRQEWKQIMRSLIAEQIKTPDHLSLARMRETLSVSRSDFYRWQRGILEQEDDLELRDEIQRIALEMSPYGYRRITAELGRRGVVANHKRVLRLMREDNLLCLRKKKFVRTTDSNHALVVYPNLAREMVLSGIDQLWLSDITYIRLQREFIYLAVILDGFSRRCIGWAIGRALQSGLAVEALRMALASRGVKPGLVHHSDRGVQYASDEYTNLLKENEIAISMSRRGNPYDNAKAESLMKTLKMEEVYKYICMNTRAWEKR